MVKFDMFLENLNSLSGDLIADLACIENIFIAGGSVIGSLVQRKSSDIDIFITCGRASAMELLKTVYDAVQRNLQRRYGTDSLLIVTRTVNAITFHRCECKAGTCDVPVQIILKLGVSIANVLRHFDASRGLSWTPSLAERLFDLEPWSRNTVAIHSMRKTTFVSN